MFFFKHYFSFIFLVSVLSFCSCKNLKNEDNDYTKEIEVIRFEKISGEIVEATIVDPVFYDKSGSKQNA